ncbi:MAG: right-handed parallel beta-helix repeat-containing protein, partial [Phycisphaerae bacterium]
MRARKTILAFLALWICAVGSPAAAGSTLDVPSAQFTTIQSAIDAALPTDLIVVAPGTYLEVIDFSGKPITLRSSGGSAVTTIDGTGISDSVVKCINGEGADTVLEGFTITGGIAEFGGGMQIINSSPTLVDCDFSANTATERGGGLYNFNSSPTVTNCTFSNNFASFMGGGMHNDTNSSPTITNCTFIQNRSDDDGGGMRNYIECHPTITNCAFIENSCFEEGGGLGNRKNSNPTVINCVFLGNSAFSGGGMENHQGIVMGPGEPTIINCLFVGNIGIEGGGMRNNDPNPILTNCTFTDNVGHGMNNKGGTPQITNCIFRNNTLGSFDGPSSPIVTYSDIEGGFVGAGNIDVDPLFVDPDGPDNDPLTLEDNDYRLLAGSDCIDVGLNTAMPAPQTTDLDGNPRIVNCTIDMGVYEFQAAGGSCNDSDGDGILDDGDNSGVAGDSPCTAGTTSDCDDNCPNTVNADQADADSDGV